MKIDIEELHDSEGFSLIPLRESDMEEIRKWRNSQLAILRQNQPISQEEQAQYYKKVVAPSLLEERPKQLLFSYLHKRRLIGYGGLVHIDWQAKRGELSFLLATNIIEDSQEFSKAFHHYFDLFCLVVFEKLKMNRLTAECYASRAHMIALLEKVGFSLEGRLKCHVFKNGHLVDSLLFGMLNKDHKKGSLLVTSISKKVPLLAAVRDAMCLHRQDFSSLHGQDSDLAAIGKYFVDNFWHSKKLDEVTLDELLAYCRDNNIKAIIPTRDQDLSFYARHLHRLQDNDIHVMVSNSQTISLCNDKLHFAEHLLKKNLPAIPSYSSIEECIFPLYVVKERTSAGSTNVYLKLSRKEALAVSRRVVHPIFQPYIEGREYSIDLYRSKSGKVLGAVARERNVVIHGESQVTTTVNKPQLIELAKHVAIAINLYGHAVIQIIETRDGTLHVVECNPRFGGASTASLAKGLQSFHWFLLESSGQDPETSPFQPLIQEVMQVRYPTDRIQLQ